MNYENQLYDFTTLRDIIREYINREPTQEETIIVNNALQQQREYLLSSRAKEIIEREISNFCLTTL